MTGHMRCLTLTWIPYLARQIMLMAFLPRFSGLSNIREMMATSQLSHQDVVLAVEVFQNTDTSEVDICSKRGMSHSHCD